MKPRSIFAPRRLGTLPLKNAIIRSATNENMADARHAPSEKLILYYEEAAAYAGLLISGFCCPSEEEIVTKRMLGLWDERGLAAYRRLCERVHRRNTPILLQIVAGGFYKTRTPDDYDRAGLQRLKQSFLHCAELAEKAGFDGIQLHLAHGYLLSQFLRPDCNHRMDDYGQSAFNRGRLCVELLQELRAQLPAAFHISAKLHCSDFAQGGMTMRESLLLAGRLADAGLDSLEISGGNYRTLHKEGFYFYEAEAFAKALAIPVFAVGGNSDPLIMEERFANSSIAAFSMSRPFTSDPSFAANKRHSRCVRCGQCYTLDCPCVQDLKKRELVVWDADVWEQAESGNNAKTQNRCEAEAGNANEKPQSAAAQNESALNAKASKEKSQGKETQSALNAKAAKEKSQGKETQSAQTQKEGTSNEEITGEEINQSTMQNIKPQYTQTRCCNIPDSEAFKKAAYSKDTPNQDEWKESIRFDMQTHAKQQVLCLAGKHSPSALWQLCRKQHLPIDCIIAYQGACVQDIHGDCLYECALPDADEVWTFLHQSLFTHIAVYGKNAIVRSSLKEGPNRLSDDLIYAIACTYADNDTAKQAAKEAEAAFPLIQAKAAGTDVWLCARAAQLETAIAFVKKHYRISTGVRRLPVNRK